MHAPLEKKTQNKKNKPTPKKTIQQKAKQHITGPRPETEKASQKNAQIQAMMPTNTYLSQLGQTEPSPFAKVIQQQQEGDWRGIGDKAIQSTIQQKPPIQKKKNNTGLPDNLKTGIENLSGYSMDDVKVHYASDKPAQLQAHAYAQGTDIHIATGQEKHLAHEAWHVVQQKQGRVKPIKQMAGNVNLNDDKSLEKEADVMGAKATQLQSVKNATSSVAQPEKKGVLGSLAPIQRLKSVEEFKKATSYTVHYYAQFWKSPTTERIDPKDILMRIDTLLGNCHSTKETNGRTSSAYSFSLQTLLDYLKGEAEDAKLPIARMQLMEQSIPKYAKTYNSAIDTLANDVIQEKREVDAAVMDAFKSFDEATQEERGERMDFAKAKYANVAHLLADIPLTSNIAALKKLLANFYARTDYTYKFGGGGDLFTGSGNCWSVCNEYKKLAADALGIEVESPGYTMTHVRVVNPRKIIGTDMIGDVDGGGNGWMWETHAIVTWNGTTIDVLYGLWGSTGIEIEHHGKEPNDYWTNDSEIIYRSKPSFYKDEWKNKYTKDVSNAAYVPDDI